MDTPTPPTPPVDSPTQYWMPHPDISHEKFSCPLGVHTRVKQLTFNSVDHGNIGSLGEFRYTDVVESGPMYLFMSSCVMATAPSVADPVLVHAFLRNNDQAWVWKHLDAKVNHAGMAWAIKHGDVMAVKDG